MAAAAMLALAGGTAWQFAVASETGIAIRQARDRRVDFRASNCAELRDWLHRRGWAVPLPDSAPGVAISGRRLIPGEGVAILYHVAGQAATLLIGRQSQKRGDHEAIRHASFGGMDLYSWNRHDHAYTMVAHGNTGCRLCHVQ